MATIFEIERLRADVGAMATTPVEVFSELHSLFNVVMSVVSARIEGNHTTVYDALEGAAAGGASHPEEQIREIVNIDEAARFIDGMDAGQLLTHALVRELHSRTVRDLDREGDRTPGAYRGVDVAISGSAHIPPSHAAVHAEMSELLDFSNRRLPMHEQMLQVAVAHHRFVWIHPFSNGNGRVSRLFTYAMLRRTVFSTRGRVALNPTSVFGNDRAAYIAALEAADPLSERGLLEWAQFFARGIRDDLGRVIRLQDLEFVADELVGPALVLLERDGALASRERSALRIVLRAGSVRAGDLEPAFPGTAAQRSRAIRSMLDRGLLSHAAGPRTYRVRLAGGPIAPRLIRRLDELGYLPKMLSGD
ncbi:Fic family protein [Microbacterium halophytorum]|uniref:Fic family protein n=1 Tax=Microbacterium halophytorum TaxID=2067568 RepID=UPI001319C9D6|nr:Fic family protein [Microbacterium halophytorum]